MPSEDPGLARYRVHGLALASSVLLPIPRCAPASADIVFRTALGSDIPPPDHSRADDPTTPWSVEHWAAGRVFVEFPGRAVFEVGRDEVVLLDAMTEDQDLLDHLFLDHVLPRLIALRGDLMLHASGAVGPSGRAHLFLGSTGAGKSTLATALAANGWLLLDDDAVRVVEIGGRPCAVPGYAGVRLLPDAAAAVLEGVAPGDPMARDHPKRRFPVDGARLCMAERPAPIAALHLLERRDQPLATLEAVGFADALGLVTPQGFHLAADPDAITRQAFERTSALVAEVPRYRLHHPERLADLPVTLALLDDVDLS